MFGPEADEVDHNVFADRCKDDRHHFRFIISPDDAHELGDLKSLARELMRDMERDLGTRLEWIGIDHWNTEHPHLHILVRGVADDGENLVIARDYIRFGSATGRAIFSPRPSDRERSMISVGASNDR